MRQDLGQMTVAESPKPTGCRGGVSQQLEGGQEILEGFSPRSVSLVGDKKI